MRHLGWILLSCAALQAIERDWTIELRAGAFIPLLHKIQKTYGHGWIEGEAEFTYAFYPQWRVWGNVNYSCKSIHHRHHSTHIQILPFSAGLRYDFFYRNVRPYIGIGPVYTFLHLTHYDPSIRTKAYKNRFGVVAKTGVCIDLPRHFFIDMFLDYYYQKIRFQSGVRGDVSGFRTGLGLGYSF
jgi:outer membrane protein W